MLGDPKESRLAIHWLFKGLNGYDNFMLEVKLKKLVSVTKYQSIMMTLCYRQKMKLCTTLLFIRVIVLKIASQDLIKIGKSLILRIFIRFTSIESHLSLKDKELASVFAFILQNLTTKNCKELLII